MLFRLPLNLSSVVSADRLHEPVEWEPATLTPVSHEVSHAKEAAGSVDSTQISGSTDSTYPVTISCSTAVGSTQMMVVNEFPAADSTQLIAVSSGRNDNSTQMISVSCAADSPNSDVRYISGTVKTFKVFFL